MTIIRGVVAAAAIGVFAHFAQQAAYAQSTLDKISEGVSDAAKSVGKAAESVGNSVADAASGPTAGEIESGVNSALKRLYAGSPEAKELSSKAVAVLVFPKVTKGGLMIGGQYGEGAMRQGGKTTGYYSLAGASYGLQIGGQQFSYAMFFMNEGALNYFRENDGWEAGSGPTLVGGDQGWSSSMGTNDLQGDIVPVFFGQEGLMAGAGLQGTKITKITK